MALRVECYDGSSWRHRRTKGSRPHLAKVKDEAYVMVPMQRLTILAFVLVASCLSAAASERWGEMSGKELRDLLSDATLTGNHDNGMPYSEWHAPDGRVFGHNNRRAVDRGCWDISGDQVCYYYNDTVEGRQPRVFCWEFRKVTVTGYRLKLMNTPSGIEATGIWQRGNPHGHSDNGKPWSCEPLQSRRPSPQNTTRLASQ
jgi:hypothetical protein